MRIFLTVLFMLHAAALEARDYRFDGSMSEEVLRNYLSRSMTMMYLLTGHGDFDDNVRMMKETGVKFAGRAIHNWGREQGGEDAIPKRLADAAERVRKIHLVDPEIILQACIFEIVSDEVNGLAIPAWVFKDFELPAEPRNFRFDAIRYSGGEGLNQWGPGTCTPDLSRLETQLWFHYLAASYINLGCEALHFGQVQMMNGNDRDLVHWRAMLGRVREYARRNARRHFVLCDAHVPTGGLVKEGKLLFDFHSFPLRIEEIPDKPREGRLRMGFTDSIYGRSMGGVTPSGWSCEHLPYLVELDNYGRSRKPGKAGMGVNWTWGWDEITWFSQLGAEQRDQWLGYAWTWVREHDSAGYLQMPGARCLAGALDRKHWYSANRPSEKTPGGFSQEGAIRRIWAGHP